MRIRQTSRSVITVTFDDVRAGWEQWLLLRADAHHDNRYCNHELERKHLEQARKRRALICDFGDLCCAMQGKWDKRSDTSQLRPELLGKDYLDRLVKYNAKFYERFADQFLLLAPGNHETSILKHHETNLTDRIAERLRAQRTVAWPLIVAGFSGWIRFQFVTFTERETLLLKWHHGYGGDAPVTKGVIQTNRMGIYLPDADFVFTGHTHNEWIFPLPRERITASGRLFKDRQFHVKVPGYKDEYDDGAEGWHIERGGPPKPQGAAWLRFSRTPNGIESEVTLAL